MAELDVWRAYNQGMAPALAQQHAEAQNAQVTVGLLQAIQQQQQAAALRDALAKGDTAALARTPGGIDILSKLQAQQSAGTTQQLNQARLQEIQQKQQTGQLEQQYKSALIPQLTQSQYQGENANNGAQTQLLPNDAAALDAARQAEAQNMQRKAQGLPEIPFNMDANNPNVTRALVAGAGNSVSRGTADEILKSTNPPSLASLGQQVRPVAGGYLERQPDGSAKFVQTRQDASTTAANAGAAGVGAMTPETLTFTAQQVLAGDRQAGQGFARSAPMKAALQNAIVEEAKKQGISGKDLAGIMSEYMGQNAGQRTLGNRQAQIELAANVVSQFAPLAVTASEAFDRTGFKSLNDVEKAVLSRTASPELRKFNFANTSLINAYARAVSPNGTPAQQEKEHAREILDTGFSKGDYKAAVDQLQLEINAELEAPGAVKAGMRKFFNGGQATVQTGTVTAPSATVAPAAGGWSIRPVGQ